MALVKISKTENLTENAVFSPGFSQDQDQPRGGCYLIQNGQWEAGGGCIPSLSSAIFQRLTMLLFLLGKIDTNKLAVKSYCF